MWNKSGGKNVFRKNEITTEGKINLSFLSTGIDLIIFKNKDHLEKRNLIVE